MTDDRKTTTSRMAGKPEPDVELLKISRDVTVPRRGGKVWVFLGSCAGAVAAYWYFLAR